VSGLCEDLTEEDSWGGDDHTDQSCQEVTITRKRNKKIVVEKTKVRRSSRIKKNQKVNQQW
jgi:hypothetical protein